MGPRHFLASVDSGIIPILSTNLLKIFQPIMSKEDNALIVQNAIRSRPGMSIGGIDQRALHQLVFEVIDTMITWAPFGLCTHIGVVLSDNATIVIKNNDEGIPVEFHKHWKVSGLEMFMTMLFAGGKSVVPYVMLSSLSAELTAQVARDGYLWEQKYQAGQPPSEVKQVRALRPNESTGPTFTFSPDFSVLEENEFKLNIFYQHFRVLAFVASPLTFTLRDNRSDHLQQEVVFHADDGLADFVTDLTANQSALHHVIHAKDVVYRKPGRIRVSNAEVRVEVELAFEYTEADVSNELSYCNTALTSDGGSHLTGLRYAITREINRYVRKTGMLAGGELNFSGTEARVG